MAGEAESEAGAKIISWVVKDLTRALWKGTEAEAAKVTEDEVRRATEKALSRIGKDLEGKTEQESTGGTAQRNGRATPTAVGVAGQEAQAPNRQRRVPLPQPYRRRVRKQVPEGKHLARTRSRIWEHDCRRGVKNGQYKSAKDPHRLARQVPQMTLERAR
jgi:hypothetical protein